MHTVKLGKIEGDGRQKREEVAEKRRESWKEEAVERREAWKEKRGGCIEKEHGLEETGDNRKIGA